MFISNTSGALPPAHGGGQLGEVVVVAGELHVHLDVRVLFLKDLDHLFQRLFLRAGRRRRWRR